MVSVRDDKRDAEIRRIIIAEVIEGINTLIPNSKTYIDEWNEIICKEKKFLGYKQLTARVFYPESKDFHVVLHLYNDVYRQDCIKYFTKLEKKRKIRVRLIIEDT